MISQNLSFSSLESKESVRLCDYDKISRLGSSATDSRIGDSILFSTSGI
tara:strand:+ start:165 stop:311 length:147 start_codon:yes stop_codon:yes gene_type:complete